jgi:sulfite reductase (NADPH) flavoprotein alpha-component
MTASGTVGRNLPLALLGNLGLFVVLGILAALLLPLHGDDWWLAAPRPLHRWLAGGTLLCYAGCCAAFLRRRRTARAAPPAEDGGAAPILVAWASQTGFARLLAERSAAMLQQGTLPVKVLPFDAIDTGLLARTRRALFVVSTTGEGDPPDHALAFLRQAMSQPLALEGLEYAVLALGDREYHDFCAFGRQLDQWLRASGAQPLFDRVEVDNADQATLRHWQYEVGRIGGIGDVPDWAPPAYEPWRLQRRSLVNDGSPGGPVFELELVPAEGPLPQWTAGDIAEVGPRNPQEQVEALLDALRIPMDASAATDRGIEPLRQLLSRMQLPDTAVPHALSAQQLVDRLQPLPHREYSIASIPGEGCVRLLVRRMVHPDGTPGLGSGWLCDHAGPGDTIDLRLRSNPGFHPPPPGRPLVLIGNGTGIAGLRAHLLARIAVGARGNWLLFGERSPGHDRLHGEEISQWQAEGWLDRVDLAFSRAPVDAAYVQHRLAAAADTLRDWVDNGASILVCGNATGMAPAVDAALADILGEEGRDALRAAGRYRRDVY